MKKKLRVSLGIFAYNEEKNIEKLLKTVKDQRLNQVDITEVIVISSGSTDNTNKLVKQIANKDSKVQLISQKKRLGKASAINLFLEFAKEEIIIVSSADILLNENSVELLVKPLKNIQVGIVGSHPVPLNDNTKFFGYAAHTIWKLHHCVALYKPKMGEFIAFRKIFKRIPALSGVDEANIEALVRGQGYQAVYEPTCIIYNKGAENLKDFIKRRKHIYIGHLATKYEYGYEVSTISGIKIFLILLQNVEFSWKFFIWTPAVIALEIYSRILGTIDYKLSLKQQPIWEIATSTKSLPQMEKLKE